MPSDPEKRRTQWSDVARKCFAFAEIVIIIKKGPVPRQGVFLLRSLQEET